MTLALIHLLDNQRSNDRPTGSPGTPKHIGLDTIPPINDGFRRMIARRNGEKSLLRLIFALELPPSTTTLDESFPETQVTEPHSTACRFDSTMSDGATPFASRRPWKHRDAPYHVLYLSIPDRGPSR